MRTKLRTATAIALALVLAGTACGERARDALQEVATEARKKLHEEPINLSHEGVDSKAELTPAGDLLIDGKPVPMNATQREAALAYRARFLAVADAGLLVGQQGASLGGEAAALALDALLGGKDLDTEEAERKIGAEADKVRAAALALCRHAQALQVEQARFVEIVPEFAPYATTIEIDPDCEDSGGEPVATDKVGA